MTSRKFLFELFLPEARFPDEKFWTKDGDPIHPPRKGMPANARGTTHQDYGAQDRDDDGDDELDPVQRHGASLFNHFSKTFPEFERAIRGYAQQIFGPNYEKVIDGAFGQPGLVKRYIKSMWDGNWTDHEAGDEIGFLFDVAQGGSSGYYNPSNYKHLASGNPGTKEDWDASIQDVKPRPSRPIGVDKQGNLVY